MKTLIIVTIFLTNFLFANYAYTGQNSGQIDMHGGKGDKLTGGSTLGSGGLKSLGTISKPLAPVAPTPLIKQETKTEKVEEKTKEETK